jgi:hypothetical protein
VAPSDGLPRVTNSVAIRGTAGMLEYRWCRKAWASNAPPSATTEGQPIGRSASLGKRSGGSPLRIETAAFLHHGCLTRAASGARSKRDGTYRCGDRHVRHPPFLLTAEVPAASEGVESLRTIYAGRSVRNPRGLVSLDGPVQPRGPQPDTGSAIRTGWCRRRAVNAVPAGKRFDSVHFPPIASKTGVNALMADVAGRPST